MGARPSDIFLSRQNAVDSPSQAADAMNRAEPARLTFGRTGNRPGAAPVVEPWLRALEGRVFAGERSWQSHEAG